MGGYNYKNLDDLYTYFQNKRQHYSSQLSRRLNPEAFRHICAVLSPKGNILGVGYNHCYAGTIHITKHAEHHGLENAMQNIIRKEGRDRLMKGSVCVDLMVLRDTGSNSRPCNNCITNHIAGNKYFNVRNVYYSHESSGLVETNTNALFEARHEHYSRFYAESLDICGGEMVGACAEEHGHGVEEDAEEEEKEGLGG
jgi:hypothetical protein